MITEQQPACSLGSEQMLRRVQEWRDLASHALYRSVEEGRIVAGYPRDARILQDLRSLIAAESHCCAFLKFRLEEEPDRVVVELSVPSGMTEEIALTLGLVTQQLQHSSG